MKRTTLCWLAVVTAACGPKPAGDSGDPSQTSQPPETATNAADSSGAFRRELALHGVTFTIEATHAGSLNTLSIKPSGATQNAAVTREIDGAVTNAEVADLNVDGMPEVYVYVASAGSGSYGSLVAYSASKGPALLEIALPSVADDPVNSKGYLGHDEFAVVENTLVQRFPLYQPGDVNAAPSGKIRQLQYKLVAGENGWVLRLDQAIEY